LIIFWQGEIMTEDHIKFVSSILEVKASGLDNEIINDLSLPPGKSIAELLYDQKTKEENK
jgi:hypothetical protein